VEPRLAGHTLRVLQHRLAGTPLDFDDLRAELEVPGPFPPDVLQEAEQVAQHPMDLGPRETIDLPFATVDPPGSKDLDQAMHLARDGDGYVVHYAIADVAAFVRPGGAIDEEANRRGETLYFPDLRVPLHPPVLSEGAASLLPGQQRPAAVWRIALDAQGVPTSVDVRRALVTSQRQWTYQELQDAIDAGTAPPEMALIATIGPLRQAISRARHAITLDLPEQEVQRGADGSWAIAVRRVLPVDQFNAEISLLTGTCAATLMLAANVGILRTLPDPAQGALDSLRRTARALGVDWPQGTHIADVLAGLDRANPKHFAFVDNAVRLLRGAGYIAFDGTPPITTSHAGIGAPYAHVTAPLRRLVDRYGTEVCLAHVAGVPVPTWVRDHLEALPKIMQGADQRAHAVDRAVVDATEAWVLSGRVGDKFEAVVLEATSTGGTIVLDDPAVEARCEGADLPVGQRITVTLKAADVAHRTVTFTRA
jgi:exoribonuclease R